MDSLKRFQMLAMRVTLALVVVGVVATYQFNTVAAKGLALGGLAGLAGLWILYRQTLALADATETDIHLRSMKGALLRLPLYGVCLVWAHRLDTATNHGMLAAIAGLFIVHGVIMFLAFTGLDQTEDGQ